MIDGVVVRPLKVFADERGAVLHMLRADEPHFAGFGEIYFSSVHPGRIKAWRVHRRMTVNLAVPVGRIRLAMYDDRPGSPSNGRADDLEMGGQDYCLVTVPPGVWTGFQGLGTVTALIANCATQPHDPNEADRRPEDDAAIPYRWPPA